MAMREEFRTILTGEPLEWQLNNVQRAAFGLAPVEDGWRLKEVPCGLLAMCETYAYLDGLRVMRIISSGENYYEECCVDVVLTENGRIAPVKPGGKSVPLTAANLHKRRHTGVSLCFDGMRGTATIQVKDHDARRTLLSERMDRSMTTEEFAAWVAARVGQSTVAQP